MKYLFQNRCMLLIYGILLAGMLPGRTASADDFIAGYNLEYHCLILNHSLQGEDGNLKPFAELSSTEIATLYHELWHGWFIECETPREGPVYQWFKNNVDSRYADYPRDKRFEIHEEAVADFIDAVIDTYVTTKRFLSTKTPERRAEIIRDTQYLQNTYGGIFSGQYSGYYINRILMQQTDDAATTASATASADDRGTSGAAEIEIHDAKPAFAEFLQQAQNFSLPVAYVREAVNAISGVVFIDFENNAQAEDSAAEGPAPGIQADIVMAYVFLERSDLERIMQFLFEGILTEDIAQTYAENRFK